MFPARRQKAQCTTNLPVKNTFCYACREMFPSLEAPCSRKTLVVCGVPFVGNNDDGKLVKRGGHKTSREHNKKTGIAYHNAHGMPVDTRYINHTSGPCSPIVQELCESRGGRPGLSVLTSLLVSVDVKLY